MIDKNSRKKDHINYEFVILELIRDNPGGLTITDIANDTGFSRNTVSKYVSILELKNQIFSRKIGAYNLYFSRKTSFLPMITILSYYKALLNGIKENFPDMEEIFKEIGVKASQKIKFAFGEDVYKELKSLTEKPFSKKHLEALKDFYPSYDIFQPTIDISIIDIDPKNKKAVYRFKNSIFLDDKDNHIYHIYLTAGITQGIFSNAYGFPIECKIENINITNKIENSYFDLSLQIKN